MHFLGYLSGILSLLAFIPYIRDILLHKTKPERASWIIWAVLGAIAFFSQSAKGASDSLWMPGVQTLGVFIVVLLSIKNGVGGLGKKRDAISLIIAFLGIILWFLTKEALVALLIAIGIDFIGVVLTVIKAYKDPESETMATWVLASLAGLFSAFSVGHWNFSLLIYPLYIFLANLLVVIAIQLGNKNRKSLKSNLN